MWLICSLGVLISIWVAFLGGDRRLENSLFGYFEFGQFAERATLLRALAIIYLVIASCFLIYFLVS